MLPILSALVPATVRASEQTEQFTPGFQQSVSTVAIMLVVLVAAAWLLRRLSRARISQTEGDSHIRLLSQKTLGMREKLVLVEVQGSKILLGITQGNIQGLHYFGKDLNAVGTADRNPGSLADQ